MPMNMPMNQTDQSLPAGAFSRGTIFPALDKPFLGEEAVPR